MAKKHFRAYPLEFQAKIVELARAGRRPEDLAAEFELSNQTIRNWIKQADLDAGKRTDGLRSEERAELFMLRKKVNQLTIEREILSKAAPGSLGRPRYCRRDLPNNSAAEWRLIERVADSRAKQSEVLAAATEACDALWSFRRRSSLVGAFQGRAQCLEGNPNLEAASKERRNRIGHPTPCRMRIDSSIHVPASLLRPNSA